MIPTEKQQIDALWTALQSGKYWVMAYNDGPPGPTAFSLGLRNNYRGSVGDEIISFIGPTREGVIASLIAYQVAEWLS